MATAPPMMQPFTSPYSNGVRSLIHQLMKGQHADHEPIVDRLSDMVRTQRDYEEVGRLLMAIYQRGFDEAVDQQKAALERHGLKATISRPLSR